MAKSIIASKDLAKFAAEGVAIALRAREATWRGPVHIIVGLPQEIFEVTLHRNEQDEVAHIAVVEQIAASER